MDNKPDELSNMQRGRDIIKAAVQHLPQTAGVYRMIGDNDAVLYVGKAKALKRRVTSYTQVNRLPLRLQRMVALTRKMEFVNTGTEAEALLLEANLIKKLKPRFNILLRDDKMFPYIHVRDNHDYPTIEKHRGKKEKNGTYYGPFAGAGDVNRSLKALQRMFLIRNCSDGNFASRQRPCLQYHIKRCTAPCVGYVSKHDYQLQIDDAQAFLEGRSEALQDKYREAMEQESAAMQYEKAAEYRDRLKALMSVIARQNVNFAGLGDADVVGLYLDKGRCCVQVFFYRGGQNYGNHAYYPSYEGDVDAETIMTGFLAQFYVSKPAPRQIIVSHLPADQGGLESSLNDISAQGVKIHCPQRGMKKDALDFAVSNAQSALGRKIAQNQAESKNLQALADLFDMDAPPKRIEVYDNSHISGTNMVGAMIVAGKDGFQKSAYRKFNIREADKSDDYGMMREVMSRRFRKAINGDLKPEDEDWPDILLIDGGKGQLSAVTAVLEDIGIVHDLTVVAIAKGEDRNAGKERFFMSDRDEFSLPINDSTLYYLQKIRDEAHRFAVSSHQARRAKDMSNNPLDEVPGIGAKKKAALIRYFGSSKAIQDARVNDLEKVEGISKKLAQILYNHFHQ